MNKLITILFLFPFVLFGANPPYEAFLGTNGIVVISNPPNGKILIDGGNIGVASLVWTNNGQVIYPIVHSNRMQLTTNQIFGVAIKATTTNTALGVGALSNNTGTTLNVAIGNGAMQNSPDAYQDVAVGHGVLQYDTSTGGENTAVGFQAMSSNRSGYFNAALGEFALRFNTNGQRNTGIGYTAGETNLDGINNTYVGAQAGQSMTNGSFNTLVGSGSAILSQGHANSVLGYGGFPFLIFGSNNVAVGARVSPNFTNGDNNTFIGAQANVGPGFESVTNSTAIGFTSVVTRANQMVFGSGVSNYQFRGVDYVFPGAQGASGTVFTNNGSGVLGWGTLASDVGFAALEIQTNGVRLGLVTNINWTAGVTGSVSSSTATLGTTGGGGLSGTTNFMNLSVQAAKLPVTNYAGIDAGWQAWETVYSKTNAEGSNAVLSAAWQFVVPPDYATNSLKLLINYSLLNTNGPNTSNVVWGASVLVARSGTTNNIHTNLFGSVVKGSNDWIAKYDGTNYVTNLVLNLDTSSLLMPRDVAVLKLQRFATEDTYGGAVALHGLQCEYTRP